MLLCVSCNADSAAAARSGQRTIRSRAFLPHRTARHGIHRRGARGRGHARHASRICGSAARSSSYIRALRPGTRRHRGACTRSKPTTCWRWRRASAARRPRVPIVVGGHTAAAYPAAILSARRRRVVAGRRRARACRRLCAPSSAARSLSDVPGLALRGRTGDAVSDRRASPARCSWTRCRCRRGITSTVAATNTPASRTGRYGWSRRRAAVRSAARSARSGSCTRASVRERSIDSVCQDFASVGDHVFVADDLFWHHPSRSLALAQELKRRGIRKSWMLVQSRVDLVARHPGAARSVAAGRPRVRHLLRPRSGDQRRPQGAREGHDGRSHAPAASTSRATRLRRDRQLRDRSGLGRGRLRAAVGVRRAASAVSGGLHDSDAAAGHRLLRGDAAADPRAAVVAVRHAPPALGAGARAGALLRAVLRDVAAVGAEPARAQEACGSGCARSIRAMRSSCCARCTARSA